MKKTNKPIKNQPINCDNRLKNICAWALIICILLALVGGILGSLSFFGVRKASAEVVKNNYTYSTRSRSFDSISAINPDSITFISGYCDLFFNFSFYPGYFTFQVCGGSIDYTQYSAVETIYLDRVYQEYSLFSDYTSFCPDPESYPNYFLRSCISTNNISYSFDDNVMPLYATALKYHFEPIFFTTYSGGSINSTSTSYYNYSVRFYFSDSLRDNYFDFIFPAQYSQNALIPDSSGAYAYITYQDLNFSGYNQGYLDGTRDSKAKIDKAYNQGKNDGIESANKYSFLGLISAVIDAPVRAFTSLFNFEILGVNLSAFLFGLLTLALIIFIVKLFLGGGGSK